MSIMSDQLCGQWMMRACGFRYEVKIKKKEKLKKSKLKITSFFIEFLVTMLNEGRDTFFECFFSCFHKTE